MPDNGLRIKYLRVLKWFQKLNVRKLLIYNS
jgi:hypothetical protein